MWVLVPILVTSLLGTWTYMAKTKKFLTSNDHDKVCAPRIELVQNEISFLRESQIRIEGDVKEVKKDVSKILVKLGGP